MTTTLEGVNQLLEAIGEPPVTALDTGGTSDAAEAETFLTRENKRVQADGWFCNTTEQTLAPGVGNEIVLASVLRIKPIKASAALKVAIRNGKLYDIANNIGTFTISVVLEVTTLLSFDTLPPKLQDYIIKSAAIRFERYKKLGQVDEAVLQQDLQLARVQALQEDGDTRRTNVLDTDEAIRFRGRSRPIFGSWPN